VHSKLNKWQGGETDLKMKKVQSKTIKALNGKPQKAKSKKKTRAKNIQGRTIKRPSHKL
jgi:hypothetical protein